MVTPKTSNAWIFDVDGVLTNPKARKVTRPEIFNELIKRLRKQDIVAFNTGRSADFLIKNIFEPLYLRCGEGDVLRNCYAIAEKGQVIITHNEKGVRAITIEKKVQFSPIVRAEIQILARKLPYSETMFFDTTKQTMVSLEWKNNTSLSRFKEQQKLIISELMSILKKNHSVGVFKIDPTTICTDIENINAGKALGIQVLENLLETRGIVIDTYICFGDSPSDLEMYDELKKQRKQVLFIYVGTRSDIKNSVSDSIVFMNQAADAGTLQYLLNSKI